MKRKAKPSDLAQYLNTRKSGLARASNREKADELVRLGVLQAFRSPQLSACNPASIYTALLEAATLRLAPNLHGDCYLVPYRDECTLQIGYKGMLKLAMRSGQFTDIYAEVVYEGETYKATGGTNPTIVHEYQAARDVDLGEIVGAYVVLVYKSGYVRPEHVRWQEIEKRRAASPGSNSQSSPWVRWYSEMVKKSAIKIVCNALGIETVEAFTPEGSPVLEAVIEQGDTPEVVFATDEADDPENTETEMRVLLLQDKESPKKRKGRKKKDVVAEVQTTETDVAGPDNSTDVAEPLLRKPVQPRQQQLDDLTDDDGGEK